MTKLKVVTIVGTRPEIIRLSVLIPKLDELTDHVFVHTGQNSDPNLNDVFFRDLELRAPDYFLNVDTSSMGTVMGDTLRKSEEVFLREKPDAVMILGDTNSAVAAIVAERMHIPVYHMEAGNRSFDSNVPEELNRKMVDHVSTFNLPYNDFSLRNLLNEGVHPRFIQKTGSPIKEIISKFSDKIQNSQILNNLGLETGKFFVASLHRQENVDFRESLTEVMESLWRLSSETGMRVILSAHPRTKLRIEKFGIAQNGIEFHEPFGLLDYVKLQSHARCVLSDSGTIAEESSILGFKAISVRASIERPEALQVGSVLMSGTSYDHIRRNLSLLESSEWSSTSMPEGYEVDDFSHRVISFLFSTAPLASAWRNLKT